MLLIIRDVFKMEQFLGTEWWNGFKEGHRCRQSGSVQSAHEHAEGLSCELMIELPEKLIASLGESKCCSSLSSRPNEAAQFIDATSWDWKRQIFHHSQSRHWNLVERVWQFCTIGISKGIRLVVWPNWTLLFGFIQKRYLFYFAQHLPCNPSDSWEK